MSSGEEKRKVPEKADKTVAFEKGRYKGKVVKVENKAAVAAVKARRRKAGYEPVSDQKSHEYH